MGIICVEEATFCPGTVHRLDILRPKAPTAFIRHKLRRLWNHVRSLLAAAMNRNDFSPLGLEKWLTKLFIPFDR